MFILNSRMVSLVNGYGGVKYCKIGFSWTTLIFMWFVPLFRGDWIGLGIYLILMYFTRGFSIILFALLYNWFYIMQLLWRGWAPASFADWELLKCNHFFVAAWQDYGGSENVRRDQNSFEYQQKQERSTDDDQILGAANWEEERSRAVDVEWRDDDSC